MPAFNALLAETEDNADHEGAHLPVQRRLEPASTSGKWPTVIMSAHIVLLIAPRSFGQFPIFPLSPDSHLGSDGVCLR